MRRERIITDKVSLKTGGTIEYPETGGINTIMVKKIGKRNLAKIKLALDYLLDIAERHHEKYYTDDQIALILDLYKKLYD